jgi:hypothetical protein
LVDVVVGFGAASGVGSTGDVPDEHAAKSNDPTTGRKRTNVRRAISGC